MLTWKARRVIDAIVDARLMMRRRYRGVGTNESKGHPKAFFHWPCRNCRGDRFSHEA
jgi:hypothetical protein